MKRIRRSLSLFFALAVSLVASASNVTWPTESLNRNVIAVPNRNNFATGCLVSWRLLNTDDEYTTFDVLRDGDVIASNLNTVTDFYDWSGTATSKYQIVVKSHGIAMETTDAVTPWNAVYKSITLTRPNNGDASTDYVTSSMEPNDCMVGDVDGDGDYELIMKWQATAATDVAWGGYTGLTFLSCYEIVGDDAGTCLWNINLGPNVRSGSHYTEVLVMDFDGDGNAEVMCQTAAGSTDGVGNYVSEVATDATIQDIDNSVFYGNSTGFIENGPELLTVFNGETGAAIHTIWYNPNRAGGVGGTNNTYNTSLWGSSTNVGSRFFAVAGYLAGSTQNPSAIFCRGCYSAVFIWAVDFNGTTLSTRWLHASKNASQYSVTNSNGTTTTYSGLTSTGTNTTCTAYAQGNHNMSVADVDDDGKDEVIYSQCAFDDDGTLMYTTGFGHGDAMHLGDFDPDHDGLEVFSVHEESTADYGCDMHDARTGEILVRKTASGDTGRGMMADFDGDHRGAEFCSVADGYIVYDIEGNAISDATMSAANFPVYWDGDLQMEHLSNVSTQAPMLEKYYSTGKQRILLNGAHDNLYSIGNSKSCNYTKSTPCLQADIFGDWREELILWDGSDSCTINIFSTSDYSAYRQPCLMYDHTYRMGVVWQNDAYNQPPHLGYYLPDAFNPRLDLISGSTTQSVETGVAISNVVYHIADATGAKISSVQYTDADGSTSEFNDCGLSFDVDKVTYLATLNGTLSKPGTYVVTLSTTGAVNGVQGTQTVTITATGEDLWANTITNTTILNFEDASTYNSGVTTNCAISQYQKTDGTYCLHGDQNAGGGDRYVNVTLPTAFTSAKNYTAEFDWGLSSSNQNASSTTVVNTDGTTLFVLSVPSWSTTATVTDGNGTTLGTITVDGRTLACPTNLSHFTIKSSSSGTYLTVENNGSVVIAKATLSSGLVNMKAINSVLGRAYSHVALDDITITERLDVQEGSDLTSLIKNADCSAIDGWNISDETADFHVNIWSVEDDASGMKTPFIQDWVWKGDDGTTTLSDAKIYHDQVTGLPAGYYRLTGVIRAYSEGSGQYPSGATFYANDDSINICTAGNRFTYNSMLGVYDTYMLYVKVDDDGTLDFGINIKDANFNWISFKNFTLAYLGTSEDIVNTYKIKDKLLEAINVAQALADDYQPACTTEERPFSYPITNYVSLTKAIANAQNVYDNTPTLTESEEQITALQLADSILQSTTMRSLDDTRYYYVYLAVNGVSTGLGVNTDSAAVHKVTVSATPTPIRFVKDGNTGRYLVQTTVGETLSRDKSSSRPWGIYTENVAGASVTLTPINYGMFAMDAYMTSTVSYGVAAAAATEGSLILIPGYDNYIYTWICSEGFYLAGDLNGDGSYSIADIAYLVNVINGAEDINNSADVNADSVINLDDVDELVKILLGK